MLFDEVRIPGIDINLLLGKGTASNNLSLKPKEIELQAWSMERTIEEWICNKINKGLIRDKKDIETIGRLLDLMKKLKN